MPPGFVILSRVQQSPTAREIPFRRNLTSFLFCEVCWGFGVSFSSESAILPVLFRTLGASNLVIGLIPAISIMASFSQLFAGYFTERRTRTLRFVFWSYTIGLSFWGLMALWVFLSPALRASAAAAISGLLVLFVFLKTFLMFSNAPYAALMGRALGNRRGTGYGVIYASNTLAGVFGSLLAAAILGTATAWSGKFALCFAVTFLCAFTGDLFLFRLEEPPQAPGGHPALWSYIASCAREAWHDRGYRAYAVGRVCLGVSPILVYFYVVESGATAARGSLLMAVQTAGACLGILFGGRLGDRIGFKPIAMASAVSLAAAMAVMALKPPLAGVIAVAFLAGAFSGLLQSANFGLIHELSPRADITAYFSILQIVLAPVSAAASLAGGWLIDRTSYGAVLPGAVVVVLCGVVVWGLRLPRRRPRPS